MEEKLKKIKVSCKIVYVMLEIAKVALFVGAGILITILCWTFATDNFESFEIGGVTVKCPPIGGIDFAELSTSDVRMFTIISLVQIAFLIAILYRATYIFKSVANGDKGPFDQEIAQRIRKISLLLFISCFIPQFTENDATYSFLSSGNFALSFIIYGIYRVFDYGCLLQKESDETV